MPPSTYYTGISPDMPSILQVCISKGQPGTDSTRSFLLCGIDLNKGTVLVAMIEFGLERNLFEGMLKNFCLKPFEDKMAVERLIYDAHARQRATGDTFPEAFLPGMNILSYSKKEVQEAQKIAVFQQKVVTYNNITGMSSKDFLLTKGNKRIFLHDPFGLTDAQKRIRSKINKLLQYKIPIYRPENCVHWSREDWANFLDQRFESLGIEKIHEEALFTPLIYLLKFGLIPDLKTDPNILFQLSDLKKSQAHTTLSADVRVNYEPSQNEVLQLAKLKQAFYENDHEFGRRPICKALEILIEKFPGNPYLVEQLYHFHEEMQDNRMSFRLACRLYNYSTER